MIRSWSRASPLISPSPSGRACPAPEPSPSRVPPSASPSPAPPPQQPQAGSAPPGLAPRPGPSYQAKVVLRSAVLLHQVVVQDVANLGRGREGAVAHRALLQWRLGRRGGAGRHLVLWGPGVDARAKAAKAVGTWAHDRRVEEPAATVVATEGLVLLRSRARGLRIRKGVLPPHLVLFHLLGLVGLHAFDLLLRFELHRLPRALAVPPRELTLQHVVQQFAYARQVREFLSTQGTLRYASVRHTPVSAPKAKGVAAWRYNGLVQQLAAHRALPILLL